MYSKLQVFLFITLTFQEVIRPRQKIPSIKALQVLKGKISQVDSSEYEGKYSVFIFYPFDFTYVCPTELIAFSEKYEEFKKLETVVYGVSTDSHFTHLKWTETSRKEGGVGELNYPLIADFSKKISKDFGFLVEDPEDELVGAALRGLVIVNQEGVVRHVQINDASVGRSVDEVIRLVQAFKHSDKYGDVCPANWKPGSNTIIPDQIKKLEYFNKEFQLIINEICFIINLLFMNLSNSKNRFIKSKILTFSYTLFDLQKIKSILNSLISIYRISEMINFQVIKIEYYYFII